MSSAVYYRFKSQHDRNPQRVAFDGTGISVFDLKREILLANHLETTADSFDLKLSNPDTGELYSDDAEVIPRSTSVVARRGPVARIGGHNSAARYVSGSLVVNAKNATRREEFKKQAAAAAAPSAPSGPAFSGQPSTEEDMINAMFQAQGEQWQKTQQEMETKAPVYTPRAPANSQSDKPLPPSYICHRCGQKGHLITNCPTLNDPTWEAKRVRRTTGIPKSMLQVVDKPPDDDSGTYLMNADGQYVRAIADSRSWQDFQRRQQEQTARSNRQVPDELKDPLTNELMVDPVKMPCCGKVYGDAAIQSALINADFTCPNCGQEDVFIDQLEPDEDMARKLHVFDHPEDDMANESGDGDKTNAAADDNEEANESRGTKRARPDSDDEKSSDTKDGAQTKDGVPVPPVPFFPFMFPPFMMPGMVPPAESSNQKGQRSTVKPYEDAERAKSHDDEPSPKMARTGSVREYKRPTGPSRSFAHSLESDSESGSDSEDEGLSEIALRRRYIRRARLSRVRA